MEFLKKRSVKIQPARVAKQPDLLNGWSGRQMSTRKTVQVLPAEACRPEDASPETAAVPIITVNPPIADSGSDPPSTLVYTSTMKDRLLKQKHLMLNRMCWLQLIFVTLSMAAAETTNKVVLAACTFSVVAGIALDLEAEGNVTASACFGSACLVFLAATACFTWQVGDMERIAGKYRAADKELRLEELGEEEQAAASSEESGAQLSCEEFVIPPLGPIAMKVGSLQQNVRNLASLAQDNHEAVSLLWLMATAKRLSNLFELKVLCVLHAVLLEDGGTSNFPAPMSNLKSYDRAYEKALIDYGKKYELLKDMLRGSIICKTMKQLRKVWQRLQQLQAEGVLKILQVKNRFRGKPFPTGYRDLNCSVDFEGFICEIQMHCEAHYVLKDEQHKVYSLCRSFGLMGDTDVDESEDATATGTGDVDRFNMRRFFSVKAVSTPLKMYFGDHSSNAVSILRSFSCSLAMLWGFFYFTSGLDQDLYGIYDDPSFEGFPLIYKMLSLCLPCWIIGGILLGDMWKDGKKGFFFCLAFTLFWAFAFSDEGGGPFNGFVTFFSCEAPFIYFVINRLLWWHFRSTSTTAHVPRVALLCRQYFGIDGKYFAMKSASTQSPGVLLQARAKLLPIGFVVADPTTAGWRWTFFCVLFLNCVVPPLLLSSKRPWLRQQGAMLFDISVIFLHHGLYHLHAHAPRQRSRNFSYTFRAIFLEPVSCAAKPVDCRLVAPS